MQVRCRARIVGLTSAGAADRLAAIGPIEPVPRRKPLLELLALITSAASTSRARTSRVGGQTTVLARLSPAAGETA